jgi:acetyl esterase/lipase
MPTPEPSDEPAPAPSAEPAPRPALTAEIVSRATTIADGARVPFGEPLALVVRGAAPGERVVVKVTAMQRTVAFLSWARFEADAAGIVDTRVAPSREGTYEGIDPDGLLWSAVAGEVATALERNDVRFVVEAEKRPSATVTVGRDFGDTAKRVPVDAPDVVGALYVPRGEVRRGVIVAFGGSEGGSSGGETYAAYWAERGYASLALAYFGATGLPRRLERVPLEYFSRAIAWLDTRKDVDASKIAVMGGSRGGEAALAIASKLPRVAATIAFVPSGVAWGAPTTSGEVASWTHGGGDLPFVPYGAASPTVTVGPLGERVEHHAPVFDASLDAATPAALASAAFRVEGAAGPVLMLGGADDQIWPSCRLGELAMQRLRTSGHAVAHQDEALCFGDAGHGFGFPGLSTVGADISPDPWGAGSYLALGGTPKGTARASREADEKVRALLTRVLH